MSVFSTNQVRHLYVMQGNTSITVKKDVDGNIYLDTQRVFLDNGEFIRSRSDLITNVLSVTATDYKDARHNNKQFKVVLDPNVNGGEPISGQDYILRIAFRQYIGVSEEDYYPKYGVVHAYAGMTASDFYKKMAMSITKNFSREVVQNIIIALLDNSGNVAKLITNRTKESELTGTYYGILILEFYGSEYVLPWRRGVFPVTFPNFTVQQVGITVGGEESDWAVIEDKTNDQVYEAYVGNGKAIADLEYFCLGERGDIYRNIGFPHNLENHYLVDPSNEYYVVNIHYAYIGSNENPQKSEKDITVVAKTSDKTHINKFITDLNAAAGTNVATFV